MKKAAGYLLRIVVSAGIIAYIFTSPDISVPIIAEHIGGVSPGWLVLALLGYKACILLSSYRWLLLMKAHGIGVSFSHSLGLNYLGFFFNNFMLSLTGGDIIKAYYASRLEHSKRAEAATIVFIDRLIGLAGLVVLGAAAVAVGRGEEGVAGAFFIVIAALAGFALLGAVSFNKKVAGLLGKMVLAEKIKRPLRKVHDSVYFYRNNTKILAKCLCLSVVLWCFMVLMNVVLARGLGADIRTGYFFIFVPVINLISSVPVTIGGWGLREQMYVQFFGVAGVERALAVSLSVSFALILVLWSLVGGVLYAFHWPMRSWQGRG